MVKYTIYGYKEELILTAKLDKKLLEATDLVRKSTVRRSYLGQKLNKN